MSSFFIWKALSSTPADKACKKTDFRNLSSSENFREICRLRMSQKSK